MAVGGLLHAFGSASAADALWGTTVACDTAVVVIGRYDDRLPDRVRCVVDQRQGDRARDGGHSDVGPAEAEQ